jgi:putative membrane protein
MFQYIITALPYTLAYLGVAVSLLSAFVFLYTKVTPHSEVKLIREGNSAAALQLSGSIIGFVIAISSVIFNSINIPDVIVWSCIALVIQLGAFMVLNKFLGISNEIKNNNVACGLFIGAISLAIGIIQAVCMVP